MLLQALASTSTSTSSGGVLSHSHSHSHRLLSHRHSRKINPISNFAGYRRNRKINSVTLVCVGVGIDEIAEVARNKVLISAAVSAAIGQLAKPFTSAILYGKKTSFDFKSAFEAGGFPSTHSSAAVATATSLGLDRGFSDSVFGLAVVYAALIMYDAQGVRREVGIHAQALNRLRLQNSALSNEAADLIDSQPGNPSSDPENYEPLFLRECEQNNYNAKQKNAKLLLRSDKRKEQSRVLIVSSSGPDTEGQSKGISTNWALLKESIGHSETEVIAGALLGLLVSLAVDKMA